jgi:hypothetical protein
MEPRLSIAALRDAWGSREIRGAAAHTRDLPNQRRQAVDRRYTVQALSRCCKFAAKSLIESSIILLLYLLSRVHTTQAFSIYLFWFFSTGFRTQNKYDANGGHC